MAEATRLVFPDAVVFSEMQTLEDHGFSEGSFVMTRHNFDHNFKLLTGYFPFPWQVALYDLFIADQKNNIPDVAALPTGLGKTNVIAVWLLALMAKPEALPRRLVYVVNRRTVVDQTTTEVQRLRENLKAFDHFRVNSLAISTLRGQFVDNAEWFADPSRTAVICGTVDMIGSRLLFGGYRIGFKSRPLHAGFLGQDALIVHDEAHLEPAFQKLLETVQDEQKKERDRHGELPWPGLRVMALSATARRSSANGDRTFGLSKADYEHPLVTRRINASKTLRLHPCFDEKKSLAVDVVEQALQHRDSGAAILVFLQKVDDAMDALARLNTESPNHVASLTGTMRGFERDRLVSDNPVFTRFMPESDRTDNVSPAEGTVYLVCTSAGEVGVNLSADHMVCDLTTFDSLAQRLGRVNRFGDRDDTLVDVVHPYPEGFDDNNPLTPARRATLALLGKLSGDASPSALDKLPADERIAAFSPEPTILPATDIIFDAWALTTIQGKLPGRPPVAPYLHGVAEWEPPRTSVAWREEVRIVSDDQIQIQGESFPRELLADFPLKPHELLSDRTDRIYDALKGLIAEPKAGTKGEKRETGLARARKNALARIWLVEEGGTVLVTTLGKLLKDDKKQVIDRLEDCIVLLPPAVGGLSEGMLVPDSMLADDVSDQWTDEKNRQRRQRLFSDELRPSSGPLGMALIRTLDTDPFSDENEDSAEIGESTPGDASASETHIELRPNSGQFWHWYVMPRDMEDATRASIQPIKWEHHTRDVVERTTEMVEALNIPNELKQAVILAAELHDLGKQRDIWQRSIGNLTPEHWYAKPGKPVQGPRWRHRHLSDYRHEFGSLLDSLHSIGDQAAKLAGMEDDLRDVVLHLIAAHHGYGRPHFPATAYDYERYTEQQNQDVALEVMRRYARLQRRYGRWGLAYLESLLRSADWAASANPTKPVPEGES